MLNIIFITVYEVTKNAVLKNLFSIKKIKIIILYEAHEVAFPKSE
jgi:hypothetical protein